MKFEPSIEAVEATRVVHDGGAYVVASIDGRVHCLDGAVFDLLFKPRLVLDQAPVPGAELGPEDLSWVATRDLSKPEPVVRRNAMPLRQKMAEACVKKGVSNGRPVDAEPARPPKVAGEPKDLLNEYPEALRHPLATTQRAVWRSLKEKGPADLSTLCERLEIEISAGASALHAMRQKALVEAPPRVGGAWSVR